MKEELQFASRQEFREWLSSNDSGDGVWLLFVKDGSSPAITPAEALEEALCFGWIDGQIRRIDGSRYGKYFSPRRKGSRWSDRNRKLAERLIREGLMTARGFEAIERARRDGAWDAVQDRTVPEERFDEFEVLIGRSADALANFRAMPRSTRRQFVGLYLEAKKEETRARRLVSLIDLLERNRKPM
ncbi:MAG: YdeI/OmpD-associated family protein [Candidatus Fermentibacter sp.]|nr:YdeI/OmpD-associated family protein [Candidatus Fermentibacter sp.]